MSNVFSIFNYKKKKQKTAEKSDEGESLTENPFESIMIKNEEKKEKHKLERKTANKGVLRSHRIKG